MRALRIISLLLVAVFLLGSAVSCKPASEITVSVKVYKHTGESIIEPENVVVQGEEPAVLDALIAACQMTGVDLELSDDGKTIIRIDHYGEPQTGEAAEETTAAEDEPDATGATEATAAPADPFANYYWSYTLNGKEPEEDGGAVYVKKIAAGDAIVFTFVEYIAPATTTKKP